VADKAELTVEEVTLALEAGAEVESLYKTIPQADGSETYLLDKVASASAEKEKEEFFNHMLVGQLLKTLPGQERSLITMRYFQEKTQSEIAQTMGISQVQVSRMEKRILLKMRSQVL
jgi:RNA polymerase sporulation-specific sigma factor